MLKRAAFALLMLLGLVSQVSAASRFWVPLTVTGAISGTGGLCRLTVNNTANLTAGNAVIVAGILGATACDGTTTVTTVVDTTHVEVNLAFGLAYTSGGTVAGGNWTSTGTGNWSASSGGAGGSSVPGSADDVTFDGLSGGGTVTVNFGGTISIGSLTCGAFTGTLDFSANNNSITISNLFNGGGSATRTLNLGGGTWTFTNTGTGTPWTLTPTTNLTFNANSSTILFSGTTALNRNFATDAVTYNKFTIGANPGGGVVSLSGSSTYSTVTINGPNSYSLANLITVTTTTLAVTGTSGSEVLLVSDLPGHTSTISVASGTQTLNWVGIRGIHFSGGATFSATNGFDMGLNSGISFPASSGGGGGCILGGWLLERDIEPAAKCNFPAFSGREG